MIREWKTPAGEYSRLFADCLAESHLLIAGATGSGKSVFENGLIYTALYQSPATVRFILIDPKLTELAPYRDLPHTLLYACEGRDMIAALQYAVDLIMTRYRDAQRRGIRTYDGSDVYVIVDELQDLMTTHRRDTFPLLQRIAQIGRAARVHLIACTQSPICKVIPTELKCNFDARIALRTATKQDSRNILDLTGCESLPNPRTEGKAYGYYRHGGDIELYQLPYVTEAETRRMIDYWKKNGQPRIIRTA